jgi:hypothetical protein
VLCRAPAGFRTLRIENWPRSTTLTVFPCLPISTYIIAHPPEVRKDRKTWDIDNAGHGNLAASIPEVEKEIRRLRLAFHPFQLGTMNRGGKNLAMLELLPVAARGEDDLGHGFQIGTSFSEDWRGVRIS